ncbi:MAG: hypothetical protein OEM60_15895, partial [Gammaproteobacteria bacterium]|nr:hypothetical protein [Gammaproteobacteria bacterium]
MSGFKQPLGKFLTGEIEFSQLQAELDIELASNPGAGPELLQLLRNLYGAGRLPQQLYDMLAQRILQTQGTTQPPGSAVPPVPPAPPTGVPPGTASPADEEDDGKTRLRVR